MDKSIILKAEIDSEKIQLELHWDCDLKDLVKAFYTILIFLGWDEDMAKEILKLDEEE